MLPAQPLDQHTYTEEERRKFEDPDALMKYRKELETAFSALWPLFYAESDVQKGTFAMLSGAMKEKLHNERLENLLIPDWPIGCRRITPGIGYLETVASDKVDIVFGEVQKITETGCIGGDGVERPLDVLICATGFDTSNKPQFPLIGIDGHDLNELWATESESYWGVATYGFPNYFMVGGPGTPVANGPVLIALGKEFTKLDFLYNLMVGVVNRGANRLCHQINGSLANGKHPSCPAEARGRQRVRRIQGPIHAEDSMEPALQVMVQE